VFFRDHGQVDLVYEDLTFCPILSESPTLPLRTVGVSMNNCETAREMRERAEECRRESERSFDARERAEWLSLADDWLKLARDEDFRQKVIWATRTTATRTTATPALVRLGAA
jgi:hypothetical protein